MELFAYIFFQIFMLLVSMIKSFLFAFKSYRVLFSIWYEVELSFIFQAVSQLNQGNVLNYPSFLYWFEIPHIPHIQFLYLLNLFFSFLFCSIDLLFPGQYYKMTLFLIRKAIKAYYRKIRKYTDTKKQKTPVIASRDNYHFFLLCINPNHLIYLNMYTYIFIK